MVRSVAAIVIGFLLIGVLSMGADIVLLESMPTAAGPGKTATAAVLVTTLAYAFVFVTFAAWIAALIAQRAPMRHALTLGAFCLLVDLAVTVAKWQSSPAWYHVVALLAIVPAAWLGGTIREWQLRRRASLRAARVRIT